MSVFNGRFSRFLLTVFIIGGTINTYANTTDDPCAGPNALLSLVNRPTVGDSVCTVPAKEGLVETGYQSLQLFNAPGTAFVIPQAVIRVGLPADTELVLLLPTYIRTSQPVFSGATGVVVGVKHRIGYNATWVTSIETLISPPSGSAIFGYNEVGAAINGLVQYNYNSQLSVNFMMGITTQTQSALAGGKRYTGLNPDLVIAYAPTLSSSIYVEGFALTQNGNGLSAGSAMDIGILYLITPNFEVDAEVGHRISGNLAGYNTFYGVGFSILMK